MFRLGGSARKNYQNGTDLSDIEKLIEKRAGLRDKALGSMRTMLPLSVLASPHHWQRQRSNRSRRAALRRSLARLFRSTPRARSRSDPCSRKKYIQFVFF